MEMPVEAESSGPVQSIAVRVDQTVQEGDVLVVWVSAPPNHVP